MIDRRADSIRRFFFTSIEDFLAESNKHRDLDIYFGVSTRYGKGSGKKRDCYRSRCVWMDLDNKDRKEFFPKPDIIVDSGNGQHIYWLLKTPVIVRNPDRASEVEAVNRGLVSRYGGDEGAIDVSRILRVPTFFNHKNNDNPSLVRAYLL